MNTHRRRAIRSIEADLNGIVERVQDLLEEEQQALDNLPESLQGTEKADRMALAIEYCENAISSVENATDELTEAREA